MHIDACLHIIYAYIYICIIYIYISLLSHLYLWHLQRPGALHSSRCPGHKLLEVGCSAQNTIWSIWSVWFQFLFNGNLLYINFYWSVRIVRTLWASAVLIGHEPGCDLLRRGRCWMDVWINQRNTDVGKKTKTSQRKTRKPGDGSGMNVEIDGLVRLALLDGSGAVVFWQRMARSIARASAMFSFD